MNNLILSKKGSTLAYIMMVMVVVLIVVSVVTSLAMTNIRQASAQEQGMQAYYVARSGAELAYEALTSPNPPTLTDGGDKVLGPENINFEKGTAKIKATITTEGDGRKKIRIESVGTLDDNENIARTVTLEFYKGVSEYTDLVWSN